MSSNVITIITTGTDGVESLKLSNVSLFLFLTPSHSLLNAYVLDRCKQIKYANVLKLKEFVIL